jgi:Cdc6-like AAA superfamily ATPase
MNAKGDRTSRQIAALFICGAPGIGKTTAVNYCCQLLQGSDDGIWRSRDVTPVVVHVNCAQLAAGGDVLKIVKEKMWKACDAYSSVVYDEKKMRKILTSTEQSDPKRFVILVLDEIDQLVHRETLSDNPQNKGERLIDSMGVWSGDSNFRFAVIGIGNTMNGPKYRRVQTLLKVSTSSFRPASN